MKKNKLISLILIVVVLASIIIIKMMCEENTNDENSNVKMNNNTISFDSDPVKYKEKYDKVKGIVSSTTNNGATIITRNTFFIDSNLYVKPNYYEDYTNREIVCKENTNFLNYMDMSKMKFEDIKEGDIIIFEGNVEVIGDSGEKKKIRFDENDDVLILKRDDLYKMANEQYKGITELKDVDIVGYTKYIEKYNVKYFWGRFKFKTFRGHELYTLFGFQISDDTEVEDGETDKYADIWLKNDFEEVISSPNYGYVRDIKKIKYK